jgi:hypothetical protein
MAQYLDLFQTMPPPMEFSGMPMNGHQICIPVPRASITISGYSTTLLSSAFAGCETNVCDVAEETTALNPVSRLGF